MHIHSSLSSQRGFSLIEGLLVVLVITVIGFGGFYVYNAGKNSKDKSVDTAAKTNASQDSKSDSEDKFVFKELGVQITLPSELKGLTSESDPDSTNGAFKVTTPDFASTAKDCKTENKPGFATVFKESGTSDTPTPPEGSGGLLKQFDGFYIYGGDPLYGLFCRPFDDFGAPDPVADELADKQAKLYKALREAFKTAEQIR